MIKENVERILRELPEGVQVEAAAKTRNAGEILEAIEGGIQIIGENYLQEAKDVFTAVGKKAKWHFIGHLQTNKVKEAIKIFDMIETVDSLKLAAEIDRRCRSIHKIMPLMVEINSAREEQKFGVMPEEAEPFIRGLSFFNHIKVVGLMTMGPLGRDPEDSRTPFRETKKIFDTIKSLNISGVDMKYLSMGMTGSYRIAIAEGANIVRIGTGIFGKRIKKSEKSGLDHLARLNGGLIST